MNLAACFPDSTAKQRNKNSRSGRFSILALILAVMAAGCATRVERFNEETFASRLPLDQMEWLDQEPSRPYIELARITVTSANLSDATLRRNLLQRAQDLGADAVVREAPVTIVQFTGSPNFEQGLFTPAGAAFLLHGYGWYMPFTSNPYILSQGATDQPRVDHYVSAIAIRYDDERPGETH
jgi:hypothetical protein